MIRHLTLTAFASAAITVAHLMLFSQIWYYFH